MDKTYIGHFRMPVWAMLAFPLLTAGSAWMAYMISQDALYADLLAHPGGPFGWVFSLPRPVVFALFAFGTVMFGFGFIYLGLAAIQKKQSFAITPEGVRQFGVLGQRDRFLRWDAIASITEFRGVLMFSGIGEDGRKETASISMMGHKKAVVHGAILANRPDFKPYL